MLIKPIYLYKFITFFTSLSIINPLTLLIIPMIGSLIILSYPFLLRSIKGLSYSPLNQNLATLANQETSAIKELIEMPVIEKQNSNLKKIAIITSLINFFFSLILWIKFDSNYIGYQFITSISTLEFIQLNLGVDGISLFFVLLTTFITPIALLSSHNDIEKNLRFYLVSILLLETLQIAVFVVLDLLLFYVFFESVLIPLFFIVGVWGASAAKVRAAFLLFLYTLKNQCKRAKLRGLPKALITKLFKETY